MTKRKSSLKPAPPAPNEQPPGQAPWNPPLTIVSALHYILILNIEANNKKENVNRQNNQQGENTAAAGSSKDGQMKKRVAKEESKDKKIHK